MLVWKHGSALGCGGLLQAFKVCVPPEPWPSFCIFSVFSTPALVLVGRICSATLHRTVPSSYHRTFSLGWGKVIPEDSVYMAEWSTVLMDRRGRHFKIQIDKHWPGSKGLHHFPKTAETLPEACFPWVFHISQEFATRTSMNKYEQAPPLLGLRKGRVKEMAIFFF